ncbi:hypothetical protein MYX65_11110 [Acidobacteria bacterium AH-259-L09]|nr:hypothetical protein [Acidobacteria bacterium AH-259-L09]
MEIAGYKLDRVLELDMVPPTVAVRFNGNTGVAAALGAEHQDAEAAQRTELARSRFGIREGEALR